MPDIYSNDYAQHRRARRAGGEAGPDLAVTAMGAATTQLGLGATYSTTYYEPFHVARTFATLDLMTGGPRRLERRDLAERWRGAEHGPDEHLEHDLRYDRADEFMEVVLGHWDAWDDDALVLDKASGRFADPAKVHRLDHAGAYFTLARPVHRAALAAGPPGADPGRAVRPRPALRRALGGDGLRRLPRASPPGRSSMPRLSRRSPPRAATPTRCMSPRPATRLRGRRRRRPREEGAARHPAQADRRADPALGSPELRPGAQADEEPLTDDELACSPGIGLRDRVVALSGKRNPSVATSCISPAAAP